MKNGNRLPGCAVLSAAIEQPGGRGCWERGRAPGLMYVGVVLISALICLAMPACSDHQNELRDDHYCGPLAEAVAGMAGSRGTAPDTVNFWHVWRWSNGPHRMDTGRMELRRSDTASCLLVEHFNDSGLEGPPYMFVLQDARVIVAVPKTLQPNIYTLPVARLFSASRFSGDTASVQLAFKLDSGWYRSHVFLIDG